MTLFTSLIVVFFLYNANAGDVVTQPMGPMGFSENYNFVNTNEQYSLRFLNTGYWSYGWGPFQFTGIWWNSLQSTSNHSQPNFEGDYIWGSIYVGSIGTPPISWLGYYSASVSSDRNIPDKDNFDWVKFNVSVSTSFIASSFLNLVEKDSAGNIVNNQSLSNSVLILNKTKSDLLSNLTAGIYAYSFQSGKGPNIEIQYILTQQAGTLNVLDGVLVVPKALETIVYINDYQYKSPSNYLTLQIAVGTAETNYDASGEIQAGGNSTDRVFYRLANKAAINGKMKSVKIHFEKASVTQFGNDDVQAQLTQRYDKEASCSIVNVEFEAGAANIVYDPTMGAGESPFYPNNSHPDTSLIVGLSCGAALLVIVVIIIVAVVLRKRSEYKPV